MRRAARWTGAALLALVMSTTAAAQGRAGDPLEPLNRRIFTFNAVVDHFVFRPVAEVYQDVVPTFVRQAVGNVAGTIGDAWSAVNLVLQGKPQRAAEMTMRVGINAVLGMGGVLDVATELGLERQSEDMGQTLATWGVPDGPYLVLPLLGASTLRDTVGLPADILSLSSVGPAHSYAREGWLGTRFIHARAEALPFTRMLSTISLDPYTFVRDAHLARRRSLIHDGNPPPEPEDGGATSDASEPAAAAVAAVSDAPRSEP